MGITVLSLFDGMSCGQIALHELGIKVDTYYASEIDKFCIAQTQLNFPGSIQLGDVRGIDAVRLPKIDLILAGSPCQGFSFAGKRLNFEDPRSALFFEFIRILGEAKTLNPQVLFLLENVRMKQSSESVISDRIGLLPVIINSSLVSAQNRVRMYWSNIRTRTETNLFETITVTDIPPPKDRGLYLRDILEDDVPERFYLTESYIKKLIEYHHRQKKLCNGFCLDPRTASDKAKAVCIGGKWHDDIVLLDSKHCQRCFAVRGRNPKTGRNEQTMTLPPVCKTNCLTSVDKDNLILQLPHGWNKGRLIKDKAPSLTTSSWEHNNLLLQRKGVQITPDAILRRLTPIECARLQTIPEWYKWECSETQQYRMLGNGWTVEVIKHILSFIKKIT